MIPRRVALRGFMCYRDEASFDFDGASLFVLAGRNGAGKSAVFDAITFALYGKHRGGDRHAGDLINHQANSLFVEVDFAVGDDVYRVRRTLGRRSPGSAHAFFVAGPSPPRAGATLPCAVPDTDSVSKLEAWVERVIGLNFETFCASVLLLQGSSDAMIKAGPAKRHEMLSQLVDLSRYQRLYERAHDRHRQATADEKACVAQLAQPRAAPVDEIELDTLVQEIVALQTQIERATARLNELAGLRVRAETWQRATIEHAELTKLLAESDSLLVRAEDVERDAAERDELARVVPALAQLLDSRDRLAQCCQAIAHRETAAARWKQRLEEVHPHKEEAQRTFDVLTQRRDSLAAALQRAQAIRLAIATHLSNLSKLDDARAEAAAQARIVDDFEPDLDQQTEALARQVEGLLELKDALPWLRSYAKERDSWRTATAALAEAEEELASTAEQISQATAECDRLQELAAAASLALPMKLEAVAKAETRAEDAQHALDRLSEVAGQPACSYCGQPLKPAHLAQERRRLTRDLRAAQTTLVDRRRQLTSAKVEAATAAHCVKVQEQAVQALLAEQRRSDEAARAARHQQAQGAQRAADVLAALPERYRVQVIPRGSENTATVFAESYPTKVEIAALASRASALPTQQLALQRLLQRRREREQAATRRDAAQERADLLEAEYPAPRAIELRTAEADASREEEASTKTLRELVEPLRAASDRLGKAAVAVAEAQDKQRTAVEAIQAEDIRRTEIERDLASRRAALPPAWREPSDEVTREGLDQLHLRLKALDGAPEALDQLHKAQRDHASRRERLAHVARELADVPETARRLPEQVDEEVQQTQARLAAAADPLQATRDQHAALEIRRQVRSELEAQRRDAARRGHLYGTLARLLGKDHLQRHLLRRAEQGIVESANEVLDRVSTGTLRLELRGASATRPAASKSPATPSGTPALDLVAYNSAVSAAAMPVHNLSGSQRFRVAVSLALGIGRWYAAGGGHRIESVIIDEGFGSLDPEGRREMIDELHDLKDVLRRIILVSHQEEFAESFKHGYRISLANGTSVASPL